MYNILKLNEISPLVNNILTNDYNLTNECETQMVLSLEVLKCTTTLSQSHCLPLQEQARA